MQITVSNLSMCLLGGVIVNVAVAWGCALWAPLHEEGTVAMPWQWRNEVAWTAINQSRGLGGESLEVMAFLGADRVLDETGHMTVTGCGSCKPRSLKAVPAPNWSRMTFDESRDVFIMIEEARGWPMRSMWRSALECGTGAYGDEYSYETPSTISLFSGRAALPLHPIATGFAVNSIVYAVAV